MTSLPRAQGCNTNTSFMGFVGGGMGFMCFMGFMGFVVRHYCAPWCAMVRHDASCGSWCFVVGYGSP